MARVKRSHPWLSSLRLVALDVVALFACGVLATGLHGYSILVSNFTALGALLVVIVCLIGLSIVGGYDTRRNMGTLRYFSEHVLAMGAVLLLAFVITYSFAAYNESIKPGRSVLVLALILFVPVSLTYRYSLSRKSDRDAAARFICVVGTPGLFAHVRAVCHRESFRHPIQFLDLATGKKKAESWIAEKSLEEDVEGEQDHCEAIIADLSATDLDPEWEEMLLKINQTVPVYPVESFIETYFYKLDLSHVTLHLALDGTFKSDYHTAYGKVKSLFDAILAGSLVLVLLPLMLLIAVCIKLEDGGPGLFRQVRVGRFERPFLLYKFRTMTAGTEGENLYTQKADARITRVGRLLRLIRLDELPQLWNVLKGDMSMIGPRAEWDKLVARYAEEIPFYHLRHMVKPGITGWAQVHYGYGADLSDTREKLQYDLYYIKHYSPEMDASIVLKTIFTMLSASGR